MSSPGNMVKSTIVMEMESLEWEQMIEKIKIEEEEDADDICDSAKQVKCMTISKRHPTKQREELSWEQYGQWRQEKKLKAAMLQKQLRARGALDELIEEQLNRFHAHYNRAMVPTELKDVGDLIMPRWAPAHELATLNWLGDWRPSSLIDLLLTMANLSSSQLSSWLKESAGIERALSQQLRELRVEEAIIDEEMAEIQAICILHLPFGPMNYQSDASALAFLQSEFKKIHRVITKAQNLRFKALELVVKKLLSQADAAEFLVAFSAIQDLIHQFSAQLKLRKGPVLVRFKASGSAA